MKSEYDKNLLYDYVNGLLSDNEKTAFEKKLAHAVDLQNDLKRIQKYYSLVKSSEQSDVPRDFIENIHRKIGMYDELPDNGISPVPLASSRRNYEDNSVSAGIQKEDKNNNRFKVRFNRRFSFEVTGVLATVVILIFIFIPNVNIPERTKSSLPDEPLLRVVEEKSNSTGLQNQNASKPIQDVDAPKTVAKYDKIKAADNERLSVNAKDEKKSIPRKSITQSKVKGMVAEERISQEAPVPPASPASPSVTGNRVTSVIKEEADKRAASTMYEGQSESEVLNREVSVMSSAVSEAKSSEPIRIIMRKSKTLGSGLDDAAPSSMPAEIIKNKARKFERLRSEKLKTEQSETEKVADGQSSAGESVDVTIDKKEMESLFSRNNIAWEQIRSEDKRWLYRLNGSGQSVKTVFDKLKSAGFTQTNFPDFSNDSVTVELEINY